MAKKIAIASKIGVSVKGVFEDFVVAQTAKGYTEKTIANYRSHFKSISRHIDIDRAFSNLTQADIDGMIVSMRESGLATNSHQQLCPRVQNLYELEQTAGLHNIDCAEL